MKRLLITALLTLLVLPISAQEPKQEEPKQEEPKKEEPKQEKSAKQKQEQKPATNPVPASPALNKVTSYDELVEAFTAQKINFQKNESSRSLLFNTRRDDFEGVMIVRWDGNNGVLHLVQTIPLKVPDEKRGLFLEAAQALNHGFLFPGIGMNLETGSTYYRISIPIAPRGYVLDYELGTYTRFTLTKASEFFPTLSDVVEGKVKPDEVVLYHQKKLREKSAKPDAPVKLTGRFARTALESDWVLDFSKPDVVQVIRDGKVAVVSSYSVKGNLVTFTDQKGPLMAKTPGEYRVFLSNGKLTLRMQKDDARDRASLLTGGVWSSKK